AIEVARVKITEAGRRALGGIAGGRLVPGGGNQHETTRLHHAARRRSGRVAARGARGGRELSRPTRARDRSLRDRRSDRCDHALARTKTVGARGKAVLRREHGWWRRQYRHGPSGKMLMINPSYVVNPTLYGKVPYEFGKDFDLVSLAALTTLVRPPV